MNETATIDETVERLENHVKVLSASLDRVNHLVDRIMSIAGNDIMTNASRRAALRRLQDDFKGGRELAR